MKYELYLSSKPENAVADKHRKVMSAFSHFKNPWHIEQSDFQTPDFGSEISADFSFKGYLPGFIKGFVSYRHREMLEDTSLHDDYLQLTFNTAKIDFLYLIEEVLPTLIQSLDAYFAYIANEELIYVDFKRSRHKNFRSEIVRFYPVIFLSEDLCSRFLGMTCAQVKAKVESSTEKTQLINDGILIVSALHPLTVEESNRIDMELNALLISQK
jgi:hypothetical protein